MPKMIRILFGLVAGTALGFVVALVSEVIVLMDGDRINDDSFYPFFMGGGGLLGVLVSFCLVMIPVRLRYWLQEGGQSTPLPAVVRPASVLVIAVLLGITACWGWSGQRVLFSFPETTAYEIHYGPNAKAINTTVTRRMAGRSSVRSTRQYMGTWITYEVNGKTYRGPHIDRSAAIIRYDPKNPERHYLWPVIYPLWYLSGAVLMIVAYFGFDYYVLRAQRTSLQWFWIGSLSLFAVALAGGAFLGEKHADEIIIAFPELIARENEAREALEQEEIEKEHQRQRVMEQQQQHRHELQELVKATGILGVAAPTSGFPPIIIVVLVTALDGKHAKE